MQEALLTFVVRQEVKEGLADLLPSERLDVFKALQQRPDGVVLSLSMHRANPVSFWQLPLSQEI